MSLKTEQLVVRQHERCACRVPAALRIADEYARRVEFSRSVGDGSGLLPVTIVDVSNGGTGLEASVFVPRGAGVMISVRIGASGELIVLPCRVQRVTMISREPRYYLGLSCSGEQSGRAGGLGRLIDAVKAIQAGKESRA